MPSDYEAITRYNEDQLGKDTASRKSQVNMYSDFSHFVYEILQNADDHGATTITFNLTSEELKIEHNGIPFNEENVKAISYFGKSTSRDDLIKTGQFGLGFKSVFAFTATPAIYSGEEDFQIYGLYRLKALPRPADFEREKTRICLPFNHVEEQPNFVETLVPEEKAFDKISRRLKKLDITALLFTHNLSEIKWTVQDEEGHYLRGDKQKKNISEDFRARKTEITDGNSLHTYLVFSQPVKWHGKEYKPVEIAFFLDDNNKVEKIRSTKKPLFVLFPTTQETKIGFLINGPFRTPAHRETVSQDDEFNQFLVKKVASLICDALPKIREMGLLTVSLLEALPIRINDFPEDGMFYPIVEAVRNALLNQELLPADDGTFISSRNAKLASAEWLRTLLRDEILMQLFMTENPLKWISGEITERAKHDLWKYIREELKVEEITPDSFARKIEGYFLEKQIDDWMITFYKYLSGQEALWRSPRWAGDTGGLLRSKAILRLQDNKQEVPFRPDGMVNAYLPPPGETDLPVVKRQIVDNEQAADFLIRLGLSEPDVFDDIVEKVLPKYMRQDVSSITPQEHAMDIQKILRAMASDSEAGKKKVLRAAKNTPFLKAVDQNENISFKKPGDIYFPNEDLKIYFSGSSAVWFLNETTGEKVWRELGVESKPRFKKILIDLSWDEKSRLRNNQGNTRDIETIDYELDGLESFLTRFKIENSPVAEHSLILWKSLLEHLKATPHYSFYEGKYKWFYYQERSATFDARWKKQLLNHAWLPKKGDDCSHKPCDFSPDELPDSFIRDEKLEDQLGMKKDVVAKLAEEAGISQETLDRARMIENASREIKEQIDSLLKTSDKKQPEFPQKSSADPERRQERLAEQLGDAPNKEYEQRDRSVRTTRGAVDPVLWLRNQYKNEAGQMVCQVCKEEMPFRKRDGEHYFEAVEVLSRDYFAKEHEVQFLALCPLCAAMYKEFVKHDEGAMESLKNALMNSEKAEVALQLGELATSLRFVESHFLDLRIIIEDHE